MRHVEVAAAVCVRDGKVFAAQRGERGELAFHWEFPGGKLEAGESAEQALIREIKEELDADVSILKPIDIVEHQYQTFSITLHGFLCSLAPGNEFTISEHIDSRWIAAGDLFSVEWSAADIPFVRWVEVYIRQQDSAE